MADKQKKWDARNCTLLCVGRVKCHILLTKQLHGAGPFSRS